MQVDELQSNRKYLADVLMNTKVLGISFMNGPFKELYRKRLYSNAVIILTVIQITAGALVTEKGTNQNGEFSSAVV